MQGMNTHCYRTLQEARALQPSQPGASRPLHTFRPLCLCLHFKWLAHASYCNTAGLSPAVLELA